MTPLEAQLRRLARALDEAALEALASKGLLRRARKDLERGPAVRVFGEAKETLFIHAAGSVVNLPGAGPAQATCSCGAADICQHILLAVLHLQQPGPGEPAAIPAGPIPADEAAEAERQLVELPREQLEQWAGPEAFRAGLKIAGQGPAVIDRGGGLLVQFPALNLQCRLVAGAGLEGAIVPGRQHDPRPVVVAAVISVQCAQGIPWSLGAGTGAALAEAGGAPRSRAGVLASCRSLLAETLACGLVRASAASQQRWATLAVSALGVNLPRLALALRSLADEVALAAARDARGDPGRLLGRLAHTQALRSALENGGENLRPDLVGWHRTRYEEAGTLALTGVAAWPWRSASGYEGLAVLFWDPATRRWNSWSDARPRHQAGQFSAVARYTAPGPWEGADTPRQVSRCTFQLRHAWRSAAGRLSGSSQSRALVTGAVKMLPASLPVYTVWAELEQHLAAQVLPGLREADPLAAMVAIRPAAWGERRFDPVRQTFTWQLQDAASQRLPLELRFDDLNEPAIRHLEKMAAPAPGQEVLVGRVARGREGLEIHPFSLWRERLGVTNLALDTNRAPPPSPANSLPHQADWEDAGEETEVPVLDTPLTRFLDEVDDLLLTLAEAGVAAVHPVRAGRLLEAGSGADRLGLGALAAVLKEAAARCFKSQSSGAERAPAALDPPPGASGAEWPDLAARAEALLRCAYVSGVFRRAQAGLPGAP